MLYLLKNSFGRWGYFERFVPYAFQNMTGLSTVEAASFWSSRVYITWLKISLKSFRRRKTHEIKIHPSKPLSSRDPRCNLHHFSTRCSKTLDISYFSQIMAMPTNVLNS